MFCNACIDLGYILIQKVLLLRPSMVTFLKTNKQQQQEQNNCSSSDFSPSTTHSTIPFHLSIPPFHHFQSSVECLDSVELEWWKGGTEWILFSSILFARLSSNYYSILVCLLSFSGNRVFHPDCVLFCHDQGTNQDSVV